MNDGSQQRGQSLRKRIDVWKLDEPILLTNVNIHRILAKPTRGGETAEVRTGCLPEQWSSLRYGFLPSGELFNAEEEAHT